MPGIGKARAGRDGSETCRPPARHQQQPGTDRPVEPRQPQIGPRPGRRDGVDPVAGRIGDAAAGLRHRASELPLSVSKVPPLPVLILDESGMREVPSASLRLGGGGAARSGGGVADAVAHGDRLAVIGFHDFDGVGRDGTARAVVRHEFHDLGLGGDESPEDLANFRALGLAVDGGLDRHDLWSAHRCAAAGIHRRRAGRPAHPHWRTAHGRPPPRPKPGAGRLLGRRHCPIATAEEPRPAVDGSACGEFAAGNCPGRRRPAPGHWQAEIARGRLRADWRPGIVRVRRPALADWACAEAENARDRTARAAQGAMRAIVIA